MTFTKYFCPHCMRFKRWWQTTEGWGETIYSPYSPSHCRHCGHEIIGVTKEYVEEAVMDKLKAEREKV
jgi:hypothetical protein